MKRLVLVLVMACGGGSQKASTSEPLENRAPKPAAPAEPSKPPPFANAADARAQLPQLQQRYDAYDTELANAVQAVADAATEVERKLALERLKKAQKGRDDVRARIDEAHTVIEQDAIDKGLPISDHCANNPLASGCP